MKGFEKTKDHNKRISMICKRLETIQEKNERKRNDDSFLAALNNKYGW